MRLGWNCMKLTALVSVLGLSVWTIGCGEPASPVKPITPASSNGGEAGSTKGGGTDVPAADAEKPAEDKPADGEKKDEPKADADKPADGEKKDSEKPADEAKKEEPKADEAKKEDAPAEKKDE